MAKKRESVVVAGAEERAREAAAAEADRLLARRESVETAAASPQTFVRDNPNGGLPATRAVAETSAGSPADEDYRGVPMSDQASAAAYVAAHPELVTDQGDNGKPAKRPARIVVRGTDKSMGERVDIHAARSKRAARKWAHEAMCMLTRLYEDLVIAVVREEDL
jgi:hypothetical protein